MNEITRSTRECTLKSISPKYATAIRKHVEENNMGEIDTSILICCETISTHKKSGLFTNSKKPVITWMLVTTQSLVWSSEKGKRKPNINSALLRNIDAHDFENTAMYKIKPDSGMNITGRYTNVTKQGISFIGLGYDPAGEKFRQVLQHAIQKAHSL